MDNKILSDVFEQLFHVDCSDHVEKKPAGYNQPMLTYLSWPFAWAEVKRRYPDADYEVIRNEKGLPYFYDENSGIMCYTTVTIAGKTHMMWLPVMDGSNKAMKFVPTEYKVKNRNGGFDTKTIAAATMFDVNKTVMRCLVKNLAMFGLGLYIYAGEDLPEAVDETPAEEQKPSAKKTVTKQSPADNDEQFNIALQFLIDNLELTPEETPKSSDDVAKLWTSNVPLQINKDFKAAISVVGSHFKTKGA